ncbi:MAG TPA: response regulator transcription factor [Candidatus Dormibacteraeota bacterium]|nr:response regulator transcription factor [Candidatus Dormibacteraeota bacterium]
MAEQLRVIIAEDNYLLREGTRRLLEDSEEVDVVAAVGTAVELLDAVERMQPHAVLTDIRMPPGHHMEGIEAARTIRSRHPEVGVVVLSQHSDELYAYELLKDGTAGLAYLLKERVSDLEALVRTLREVVMGGSVIDAKVVEALLGRRAREEESALSTLSPRERQVLAKMAEGSTNPVIARGLFMSESTVEKHVSAILSKLGLSEEKDVDRRVAAVLAYLKGADSMV